MTETDVDLAMTTSPRSFAVIRVNMRQLNVRVTVTTST